VADDSSSVLRLLSSAFSVGSVVQDLISFQSPKRVCRAHPTAVALRYGPQQPQDGWKQSPFLARDSLPLCLRGFPGSRYARQERWFGRFPDLVCRDAV